MCGPGKYLEGRKNEYMNKLENNARRVVKGAHFLNNSHKSLVGFWTLLICSKQTMSKQEAYAWLKRRILPKKKKEKKQKPLKGHGMSRIGIVGGTIKVEVRMRGCRRNAIEAELPSTQETVLRNADCMSLQRPGIRCQYLHYSSLLFDLLNNIDN